MQTHRTRREFIKISGLTALGFGGLRSFVRARESGLPTGISPFGPLNSSKVGILDLPEGFEARILSMTGNTMTDGLLTPGKHDGMAAFAGPDGKVILICNHENAAQWKHLGAFRADNKLLSEVAADKFYDYGKGADPCLGGTTTLVYNPQTRKKEAEFLSLAGTEKNCAGGPTPWNSWITCEETTQTHSGNFEKDHGYNFEVPASTEPGLAEPVPLKAMGRFRHEAIAVHEPSGVVYETEDLADGLIYRFIPNQPGKLAAGGKLQALKLREVPSADTRNWGESDWTMPQNKQFLVDWIDLDDVESPRDDLRYRGSRKGAATFARGEGIAVSGNEIFWCCTSGGSKQFGQVFRYVASPFEGTEKEKEAPAKVELFVESHDAEILRNCDNCVVAPWGDLIVAEDTDAPCRIIGITPRGQCYTLALNVLNDSELAGPCFSPSGDTLFINIQNPGMTLAITGPWEKAMG